MQARESRTSSLQAERDDRREALPAGSAPQQPTAARGAIDILSKTETPKTRPCGIIAPERTQRLSSSPTVDLHLSNRQTWPTTEQGAYKYTVPQNTAAEYVYPQRNISPRQTFQENMRRILVPPRPDLSKLISEPTPPMMTYPFQLNQPISKNLSSDPKYCEVPYIASQIPKQQRTSVVRNSEVYTSNVGVPPLPGRGWPSAVPQTPPAYYPPEYYGHQQSYATAVRSKVPVKKSTDQLQQAYSENLCHSGDVRFEPYHTTKEKYPRARYDNFPNSYHSYVLPTQKYDSTKPVTTPVYVNYTPQKYVDPRIVDPRIADSHPETYVRPNHYLPAFSTQHPEYISSKFIPPSTPYYLQNKFYGHPLESGLRHISSTTKSSFEPSRLCYDQDYGRGKPLQANESSYVTAMPPYGLRPQVPLNNYPLNNAQQRGSNHMYQYRNDSSVKNYSELISQYKYPDIHTSAHNPLARIPAQFSPNVISPSESNTSMESVPMHGAQHEDCGYVSQCSTTSGRSIDYSHYKLPHYEHSTIDNRPYQSLSTSAMQLPHKINTTVKHTKNIDIRQFLQTWDEDDDDDCTKAKDRFTVPPQRVENVPEVPATSTTSEPPLYVLGYVNIPSDEIGKYEHIQKVCKLPENIRGYDNADLLNKFDEAFRPNSSNNFTEQAGNNSHQVIKPINESLVSNVVGTARAPSPFDVEAKITQSVIHKDVGCNFEIKPFSPPLQNAEASLLSQNNTERKIVKIVNPNMAQSMIPNTLHHSDDSKKCAVKRQSLSSDEPTSNNKIMKTVDSQFSFNNSENKQECIGKDFSTISGMCLASLPRLDNEMELNFQEINEQYSHLKETHESVIISTPNNSSLLVHEDQENSIEKDIAGLKTIQNDISNIDNDNLQISSDDPCFYEYDNSLPNPSGDTHDEKNPMKLSKIRRNKLRSSAEIHTVNTPQNSPLQRTDSVIIKNPDIENNSPILEDLPHFVKQASSVAETKQSSQSKPAWSSESPNHTSPHVVNKCSSNNINHDKVTMINEIQSHFTEILPLPGSKSPINLIMHSHNEEYTNCIRPSLIHCTPNELHNINNARKGTDFENDQSSENVQINSDYSKSYINEIPINVAINLSINSNQSDLYSANNSEYLELKEIKKNGAALVSVFKEKNIQSPSIQTGEPQNNKRSTLNSHELTLQNIDQANVYSDDSNITLGDKANSNEYMTSQTTNEKSKHDVSSVQKQFNKDNIVPTKIDCNEDLHSSSHLEDQPDILVDKEFENYKPVDAVDIANIGNSALLLDDSEREISCTNETINRFNFMTNSISETFDIKSTLKIIDTDLDDQLEENIENIALHIMASGNVYNNTENSISSDVQPKPQSSELQDPIDNSLHNNGLCKQNQNEVILHNYAGQIESENKIKVNTEMEKYRESNEVLGDVPEGMGEGDVSEESYCAQVSKCDENYYQSSQLYNMADNETQEKIVIEEKQNEEENISEKLENIVIETPSCLQIVSLATDDIGSEKEDSDTEQSSEVLEDIEDHKVNLSGKTLNDNNYSENFEPEIIQDGNIDTVTDINTSSECKSIQEVVTIIEIITEDSNLSCNLINENKTVDAPKNDKNVTNDKFTAQENKSEGVQKYVNDFIEKCDNVSDLSKSNLNEDLVHDAVSVVNSSADNLELPLSRQDFKCEENTETYNKVYNLNKGCLRDKITEDNLIVSKTAESHSEVLLVSSASPKGEVKQFDDHNNKSVEPTQSSTVIDSAGERNPEYPNQSSEVKAVLLEQEIKEIYCEQNCEKHSEYHNILKNFEELHGSTEVEPMTTMKEAPTVSNVSLNQEDITNQETENLVDVDAAKMYHALDHETLMTKASNENNMSASVNANLSEKCTNQFENIDITRGLNKGLSETNEGSNLIFDMDPETDGCCEINNSPKSDLDQSQKFTNNSSMYCEVDNAIISSDIVLRNEPILNECSADLNNEKENACKNNKCYSEVHETTIPEIINEFPAFQKKLKIVKPNQNMQHIFSNEANVHNEDIIHECDKVKDNSYAMGLTSVKVKKNVINNNTGKLSSEGIFECCKDLYSISKECESIESRLNCDTLPDSYIKDYFPKEEAVNNSNQIIELNKEVCGDETISNISPTEVERPHVEYSLKIGECSEKLNIHSEEAAPKHREQMNELTKIYTGLVENEDEKDSKNESVIPDSINETNLNSRKKCITMSDTSSLNDSTIISDNSSYNNSNISKEILQTHSKENYDKNIVSYKFHKNSYTTPNIIKNSYNNNNKDENTFDSNTTNKTFLKSASFDSDKYKKGIIFDTYFSNRGQSSKTSEVDDFIKSQMSLIKNKNRNTRWDKKSNADKEHFEKDTMHEKYDNLKKLIENSQSKINNNLYTHCQLTSEDSTKSSIVKQIIPSSDINNTELSSHLSFIFENLSRKRRISHNHSKDMQNKCSSSNIYQTKQRKNDEYTTPVPVAVTRTTELIHSRNMNNVAKLFLDDKESENAKRIRILSDEKKIERNIDSDKYLSKWINIDNENITTSLILGQEKQVLKVVETISKTNKSNERKQNIKDSEHLTSEEKSCSEHINKEFFIKNGNNSDLVSLTNIFEEDIKCKPLNQKHNKENDMCIMKLPVNINTESMCSEKFGLYDELWTDTEISVYSNETKLNKGSSKKHQDTYSKNFEHTLKLLPEFIEDLPLQQNINEKQSCDYLVVETETAINNLNHQHINSSPLRNEDPDKKANENHVTSGVEEKSCSAQMVDKNYHPEYAENYENSSSSQNFRNTELCDIKTGKIKINKIKKNCRELNLEAKSLNTCENSTTKEYCLAADFNEGMKDGKLEGDLSAIKTFAVPIEHIVCMEPDSTQECHGQYNANLNKKPKNIGLTLTQNKELQQPDEKIKNVSENMCEISNNISDMNSEKNNGYSEKLEECDSSQAYDYSNEVVFCKTPHSSVHSTFFDSEASCNLDDSIENQECLLIEDGCVVTDNLQIIDAYNVENASNDHCSNQGAESNVLQLVLHSPTPFDSEYIVPTSPNNFKNGETSITDDCEEIWIDDVACIETVVSEEVEQGSDSDCPVYNSPTDVQRFPDMGSSERINYDLSINFDSTKLKDIYGDNMDNNDIQLVETLYRTPHMDVRSKLNESECKVSRSKQNFASNSSDENENSQDRVIFAQETNKDERDFNSELTHTSYFYSNMSHNKQTNKIQTTSNCMDDNEDQEVTNVVRKMNNDEEKSAHSNLSYNENSEFIDAVSIQNLTSDSSDDNYDKKYSNTREMKNEGKNNFHSSLSHKKCSDIVHKLKKSMIFDKIGSLDGNNCKKTESEHFQTQTYQSNEHSPICDNKHTDLAPNIYLRAAVGSSGNTKKSDTTPVSNVSNSNCLSRRTDKLITKAAQKYVPPLKISAHNLKVQLPLPEENLRRLQHLKVNNQEHERSPIPKLKIITSHIHKNNVNLYKKKIQPKFEDVLKHIDDAQYRSNVKHRNKKKTDKAIPKVIIKKNGSQYTSTSPAVKANFNPDLTGSRWQPCVCLERYPLIDKMIAKRRTKVIFCSLTGKFVIQHKSYKSKNPRTAPRYSIEGVREKPLKCTIMLN